MSEYATWHAFYQSDLQAVWGLCVVPGLFLIYRGWLAIAGHGPQTQGVTSGAIRFVDRYAILFALLTVVDPFFTGPLVRWLAIGDTLLGSAISFAFVYLGDFRVFLLLFGVAALAAGHSIPVARAALWALIVPLFAGALFALAQAIGGDLAVGWLWLLYELSFLALILGIRARWVPRNVTPQDSATRNYLGFVCAYVATYYALWPLADVLILVGGFDAGWALRVIPNQLYYAFFIPVIWLRFFSPRYASTSESTQHSR